MKKTLCIIAVIFSLLSSTFAAAENWNVLAPGWWNASREKLVSVKGQLDNHIRNLRGESVNPLPFSDSSSADDWSILEPGWWNATIDDIQSAFQQILDLIDVLDGKLQVMGFQSSNTKTYEAENGAVISDNNNLSHSSGSQPMLPPSQSNSESHPDHISISYPSSSRPEDKEENNSADQQAYQHVDFSKAYGNQQYKGKKIILEGFISFFEQNSQNLVFTIRQSEQQLWLVYASVQPEMTIPSMNDSIVVLGCIDTCSEKDSAGNQVIAIKADYYEIQ